MLPRRIASLSLAVATPSSLSRCCASQCQAPADRSLRSRGPASHLLALHALAPQCAALAMDCRAVALRCDANAVRRATVPSRVRVQPSRASAVRIDASPVRASAVRVSACLCRGSAMSSFASASRCLAMPQLIPAARCPSKSVPFKALAARCDAIRSKPIRRTAMLRYASPSRRIVPPSPVRPWPCPAQSSRCRAVHTSLSQRGALPRHRLVEHCNALAVPSMSRLRCACRCHGRVGLSCAKPSRFQDLGRIRWQRQCDSLLCAALADGGAPAVEQRGRR